MESTAPRPKFPSGPAADPSCRTTDRLESVRIFREEASREGFARSGIARAGEPPAFGRFRDWLSAGHHAGMAYLERTRETRADPESLLPGVRSVVCLAATYPGGAWRAADGAEIARYARGADYHGTLRDRTLRAAARAKARIGGGWRFRVCVDSTPIAERSFAAAAGVGWIGKNGCLIDPEHGSFLLLAEILTDLDLPPDDPIADQCGSCTRCLRACPTDAFVAPGLLDARRCLAYWTIEHRGPFPEAIEDRLGHRVFGCDICQEVCPWNARRLEEREPDGPPPPRRREWLEMGPGEWRRRFGASALNRAGRRGIQRSAAASARSVGDASVLPALGRLLPTVREPGLAGAAGRAVARLEPAAPVD